MTVCIQDGVTTRGTGCLLLQPIRRWISYAFNAPLLDKIRLFYSFLLSFRRPSLVSWMYVASPFLTCYSYPVTYHLIMSPGGTQSSGRYVLGRARVAISTCRPIVVPARHPGAQSDRI